MNPFMLPPEPRVKKSQLHVSAQNGDTAECKNLIQGSANVNAKDQHGFTPLHLSSENGHAEVCRLLVKAGADGNAQSRTDVTPLHLAAQMGHADVCVLLVEGGAEVKAKDKDGSTALHLSASSGRADVCALLVERGAEVSATDMAGDTPLHFSGQHGHAAACALLIRHGADLDAEDEDGYTPLHHLSGVADGYAKVRRLLAQHTAGAGPEDELPARAFLKRVAHDRRKATGKGKSTANSEALKKRQEPGPQPLLAPPRTTPVKERVQGQKRSKAAVDSSNNEKG